MLISGKLASAGGGLLARSFVAMRLHFSMRNSTDVLIRAMSTMLARGYLLLDAVI